MVCLIVFLSAAIGSVYQHCVNVGAALLLGLRFLYGTLTINILSSVLMVMLMLTELFLDRSSLPQELHVYLTTGLLRGLSMFSTFSLDAITLWSAADGALPPDTLSCRWLHCSQD